jgi:SpoIID/LytB domain protein
MRTRLALAPFVLGTTVLAALLTGLSAGAPADARATAAEPPVPVGTGGITVTGDGFGHGHGMSQYGAQGAAKVGLTPAQILAFYYPGTKTGSFTGRVRVWITANTAASLVVAPAAGLTVTDVGSGTAYPLPTGTARRWRLTTTSAGLSQVSYRTATSGWIAYRPGGRATLVGPGEFRASSNLITLMIAGVPHVYRGGMRYVAGRTINVLGIDLYLRGVVPAEMPAGWLPSALAAQAVAARTYAVFERNENAGRSWQLCDTSECQVYRGYAGEQATTNAAVAATAGQILTWSGQAAFTQFSASDGGWSVAGGQPYLVAKADAYDQAYRHWTTPLDATALQQAYPTLGALKSVQVLSRDGHGEWGGRVLSVKLVFAKGGATVDGTTLRMLLGLKSTLFQVGPTLTP